MTAKNRWTLILVIIALALGVWIVLRHHNQWNGDLLACTEEARICPDGSSVGREGPNCEFRACPSVEYVWNFEEEAQEEGGQGPRTKVSVNIRGVNYDVGSHVGSCSQIKNTSWPLLDNEIDGVICWWAGAGVEIGIFSEGGELTVRKGFLEEGTAETPAIRGNFELLFGL